MLIICFIDGFHGRHRMILQRYMCFLLIIQVLAFFSKVLLENLLTVLKDLISIVIFIYYVNVIIVRLLLRILVL